MNVYIQVLHFAWEEGRRATCRANVGIRLTLGTGVIHQVAVHPVVFSVAYDRFDAFAIGPSQPGGAAFPATTRQCGNDAIVISSRNQSCLSVSRVTFDGDLVRIRPDRIGVVCEFIDDPAGTPGPSHQGTWIG